MQFPKGEGILVTDSLNPFAMFRGDVQEVTKSGKVIALANFSGE